MMCSMVMANYMAREDMWLIRAHANCVAMRESNNYRNSNFDESIQRQICADVNKVSNQFHGTFKIL